MTSSDWKIVGMALLAFTIPPRSLVGPAAFAQDLPSSRGTKSDILVRVATTDGALIPDVEIIAVDPSSGATIAGTRTNELGESTVKLPSGQYVIRARRVGFKVTERIDFWVQAPTSATLNLSLSVGETTRSDPPSSLLDVLEPSEAPDMLVAERQIPTSCSCEISKTMCLSDIQMTEHAIHVEMAPDTMGNHSNYSGLAAYQIRFDEKGRVTDANAVSGPPLGISHLMEAVSKWRFGPVVMKGVKQKGCGRLWIKFAMQENIPSAVVVKLRPIVVN